MAETYGEDKTAAVARAKAGIAQKLDADDQLAPFDLGEEVFVGNEEMQQEFPPSGQRYTRSRVSFGPQKIGGAHCPQPEDPHRYRD